MRPLFRWPQYEGLYVKFYQTVRETVWQKAAEGKRITIKREDGECVAYEVFTH